jgi:hypothetical protein
MQNARSTALQVTGRWSNNSSGWQQHGVVRLCLQEAASSQRKEHAEAMRWAAYACCR